MTDGESSHDPPPATRATAPSGLPFKVCIVLLLGLFGLSMLQRNRIRAHWWAYRLARTDDAAEQAYYVAALSAVGEHAGGAARRLARHPRPDVRSCAVAVLGRLPAESALPALIELMGDPDRDIRESAALTLAFADTPEAESALVDGALRPDPSTAAAAAAALGRMARSTAQTRLCAVLRTHPDAHVRAQAAESLGDSIAAGGIPSPLQTSGDTSKPEADAILTLVHALSDRVEFDGTLAAERQMAEVARHLTRSTTLPVRPGRPAAPGQRRTVADIAAQTLNRLTGPPPDGWKDDDTADPAIVADRLRSRIERRLRFADPNR